MTRLTKDEIQRGLGAYTREEITKPSKAARKLIYDLAGVTVSEGLPIIERALTDFAANATKVVREQLSAHYERVIANEMEAARLEARDAIADYLGSCLATTSDSDGFPTVECIYGDLPLQVRAFTADDLRKK